MASVSRFREIEGPDRVSSGWIQITADGPVPLDSELIQALDAKARKTIDVLRPTGCLA